MQYVVWSSMAVVAIYLLVKVASALLSFIAAVIIPALVLIGMWVGVKKVYMDKVRQEIHSGNDKTEHIGRQGS